MRGIWSWGATATSMATTAKGNFAISFSGIEVSPLEYVPASRSPVRSRESSDRTGFGVWLSLGLPEAEKSPFGVALIAGGTKSAVVRSVLGPGNVKRRTSMYGLFLKLLYGDAAEDLLGATENLPRFRMAELAPLAIRGQLHASDEPVALPERERERGALDLEHFAVHLGEERQDLVDEDAECGRGSLGRRAGGGEEKQGEDGRGACRESTLHHSRCQLLTP